MSMTADQIVDRRRMRRKLSFWRFVGLVALVVAVGGLAVAFAGKDAFPGLSEPQIARINISGFIAEDRNQTALIERLAKDDNVKGVIVSIDSTGGSTTGGEALYEALRELADKKPTVASIGTVGASAAYMAAIATDHIVARRTSITGSIGVIFQYPEVSELMDKIGVKVEDIKSGPLKAEPNPFEPATPEARAVIAGLVTDTFNWFVDIVAERRDMQRHQALTLADGRIYSGNQALAAKLIDEIGGEDEAIAWLATRGVDEKLPVKLWKPKNEDDRLLPYANAVALWVAQQLGLAPATLPGEMMDRIVPASLKLDGLLSVWQGPAGGNK